MNYNRGQVAGQIFVYIAGIIIVAMIIFFGLRIFSNTSIVSEKYVSAEFQNKIKIDINSLIGSSGSSTSRKYILPTGFTQICFVDSSNVLPSDVSFIPFIKNSVDSNSINNVFLIGPKSVGSFYVDNLEFPLYPHFYCINSNNGVVDVDYYSLGSAIIITNSVYLDYCKAAQTNGMCDSLNIIFTDPNYKKNCCSYGLCC
jgi:hypothetical protein